MVYALPRCGSNYIVNFARSRKDWRSGLKFSPLFKYQEHTIVKIVRDPFERWRSWFYTFGFDQCDPTLWGLSDAENFIKDFSIRMHYDIHTGLQNILYNINPNLNYNNVYVTMESVGIFLGDSGIPHVPGEQHNVREEAMNSDVKDYLYSSIRELYKSDTEWIKTLDLWGKSS